MSKYVETRHIPTRKLSQRPLTSRNTAPVPLKSDVVGRTIRKTKLMQPRQSAKLLYPLVGKNSRFSDHNYNRIVTSNSMEKEQFLKRDFERTLKKYEEKKLRRNHEQQVKREIRKKNKLSWRVENMPLEKRLLETAKKRNRLHKTVQAVVVVQRWWRGFHARRFVRFYRKKLGRCSTLIQRYWKKNKHKFVKQISFETTDEDLSPSKLGSEREFSQHQEVGKEEAMRKIDDLASFFSTLKEQKLGKEENKLVREEVKEREEVEVKEEVKQEEVQVVEEKKSAEVEKEDEDTQEKDEQILRHLMEKFEQKKSKELTMKTLLERSRAQKAIPKPLSQTELHNTFFKVNDNFEFIIDKNALHKAIEYRTSRGKIPPSTLTSHLKSNPYPPRAKLHPLNVKNLELQLTKKAQHSTHHTDSKLLKEFEINSLRPNGVLYSQISQDERLDYERYFKQNSNPESFVDFIIRKRRALSPEAKTNTIYDYQSHMPYFSKLAQKAQKYEEEQQKFNYGVLNSKLDKSNYQWLNK